MSLPALISLGDKYSAYSFFKNNLNLNKKYKLIKIYKGDIKNPKWSIEEQSYYGLAIKVCSYIFSVGIIPLFALLYTSCFKPKEIRNLKSRDIEIIHRKIENILLESNNINYAHPGLLDYIKKHMETNESNQPEEVVKIAREKIKELGRGKLGIYFNRKKKRSDLIALENKLKPNRSSKIGFIGEEQKLMDILIKDEKKVKELKRTHLEIAKKLELCLDKIDSIFQGRIKEIGQLKIYRLITFGLQTDPFKEFTNPKEGINFERNPKRGSSCYFIEFPNKEGKIIARAIPCLLPYLISSYHFYEGIKQTGRNIEKLIPLPGRTGYRVSPEDCILIYEAFRSAFPDFEPKLYEKPLVERKKER